ncbi:hypothetical protein D7V94_03400 [Parablautia intestinalis]|uniref:Uncharacterized protein n=1 Tax=Parablautia intestinalis TaxID=2320100 RepID=A0A3A9AQU4_9FIRM|nr:hypothetical protein D7V94_03400 [Parablautia intestinalis]
MSAEFYQSIIGFICVSPQLICSTFHPQEPVAGVNRQPRRYIRLGDINALHEAEEIRTIRKYCAGCFEVNKAASGQLPTIKLNADKRYI